jgi:hypothetical protein
MTPALSPIRGAPSAAELRAEAALIDAAAEKNAAWAAELWTEGRRPVLARALDVLVASQTRQASILREDAAAFEARWPEDTVTPLRLTEQANRISHGEAA